MAKKEEKWRLTCNKHNCEEAKEDMPKECNVISFGHNDEKVQVTNSATRGIVPEEIAIGKIKVENGENQRKSSDLEKTL